VGQHAWQTGYRRQAFGVVEFAPRIVNACDLIGDEFACQDAQRETMAGVPSHDVSAAFALVEPNEGDLVHGIQNLTRPLVVDGASFCETLMKLGLEFLKPALFLLLAHLVIASSNHEVVVFRIAVSERNIMVRVGLVVDEAVLDGAFGNTDGDTVCATVFQLRDDAQLLERDACRFHSLLAGNGTAIQSTDANFFVEQTFLFNVVILVWV